MSLIDCLHNNPLEIPIENKNVKAFLLLLDTAQTRHEIAISTKQGPNHLFFKITATSKNFASVYFDLGIMFKDYITKVKK